MRQTPEDPMRPEYHWIAVVLLLVLGCAGASAAGADAQQQARPAAARYVASSQGEVYYWVGCDAWETLSRVNLRWFSSAADAEAAGYRPSGARGCAPQLDTALIDVRPGSTARCVVSRIVDGDTFVCEGGSRVRLLVVDAPETGQGAYADSATLLLERLMPVGSSVRLEFDVRVRDRYGRLLAYVYAGSRFVNRELVRRGMAYVAVFPPNVREVDVLRSAADSARSERRGLWSSCANPGRGACRTIESGGVSVDRPPRAFPSRTADAAVEPYPEDPMRIASLRGAILPLAALLGAAPVSQAGAQNTAERYAANFERMRENVLAMVDSMPAEGLRSAPTEGVRDFAEQIEHVAVGNVNLIASGIDADRVPLGLERDVYLNDRAELKRLVNVAFDRVRELLTAMSAEDLRAEGRLFGQIPLPRWQIVEAAYEHGIWTLGATVPYVRLQGGAPHSYGIVPSG